MDIKREKRGCSRKDELTKKSWKVGSSRQCECRKKLKLDVAEKINAKKGKKVGCSPKKECIKREKFWWAFKSNSPLFFPI